MELKFNDILLDLKCDSLVNDIFLLKLQPTKRNASTLFKQKQTFFIKLRIYV